jgi:type IV pilus biogenesis protein CpaD/CtpE
MKQRKSISAASRCSLLLLAALPLAGCALDDITKESALEPYGGSKAHPIHVRGNQAMVEPCGQWPEDMTVTHHNQMNYNHGCAVQSNIAAMAAYPRDLVQPRRMTMPPAEGRVKAVKKIYSTESSSGGSAAGGGAAAGGAAAAKP